MLKPSFIISSSAHCPRGFSLIEVIVAIFIGAVVLASVTTLVVRINVVAVETIGATQLNRQARMTLAQITGELRRAGYVNWYKAWDTCNGTTTPDVLDDGNLDGVVDILDFYTCSLPVIKQFGELRLFNFPKPGNSSSGEAIPCDRNCSCILYSYDLNADSAQGVGSGKADILQNTVNFELFGFRWNNGAAETRIGGAEHSCNSGSWRDMNDGNVKVSNLGFSMIYASDNGEPSSSTMFQISGDGNWNGELQADCSPKDSDSDNPLLVTDDTVCLVSRSIDISLGAQSRQDTDMIIELNTTVKNNNNHLDTPH